MSTFQDIRKRLALTQAELALKLGVSQGSVSFYENGQVVPPAVATRLIEASKERGVDITFNDIYADLPTPAEQPA